MASASFMFLQIVAAVVTTCQGSSEASLSPHHSFKAEEGFFAGMGLDETMWDAFSEAVLALAVFGLASALLNMYRKYTRKNLKPIKTAKAASPHVTHPWTMKKLARCQADMSNACTEMAGSTKQPSLSKAGGASTAPAPARTGPASSAATQLSEADAVANAVKAGKASKLPQIITAAVERSLAAASRQGTLVSEEDVTSQLLITALRSCAASRCFKEALAVYDHLADRIGGGSAGLWSVLLYIVVEAGAFDRCGHVFKNLCEQSSPSGHDVVNMVRCYAGHHDAADLREMLGKLSSLGHSIDTYTLNRALAACSSSNSVLDLAEALASAGICTEGLDAVSYNTLMKYNARAGKVSRCFQLRAEMLSKGLEQSEVTFGILLDACVAAKELDRARELFDDLSSSGLQLNVVHCTSFLKVLVSAQRLDEAARVLREMVRSPGVKPDLITYSTVVKAYADSGDVSSALNILELMLAERVRPDEILFNSVLMGCCAFPLKSVHVMNTFKKLIGHGMKPTTTTLSILLKGLAHTDAWRESLQMLQLAPKDLGLEPEPRLYAQLAQACIKARHGKIVSEVFDAMLKSQRSRGTAVDAVAVGRILRSCILGGELDLASRLWKVSQQEGIAVDAQVEKMLKTAAAKKSRGSM